jgi:hypothetical protein
MSQKEFQRVKVIENAAVWRFLPQAFHRHRYLGISGPIRRILAPTPISERPDLPPERRRNGCGAGDGGHS